VRRLVFWGLVASVALGGVISYYASSSPDGLERADEIMSETGETESADGLPAPMAGYAVPGIRNARLAGGLAGVIGVAATFILCFLVGKLASRRSRSAHSDIE